MAMDRRARVNSTFSRRQPPWRLIGPKCCRTTVEPGGLPSAGIKEVKASLNIA